MTNREPPTKSNEIAASIQLLRSFIFTKTKAVCSRSDIDITNCYGGKDIQWYYHNIGVLLSASDREDSLSCLLRAYTVHQYHDAHLYLSIIVQLLRMHHLAEARYFIEEFLVIENQIKTKEFKVILECNWYKTHENCEDIQAFIDGYVKNSYFIDYSKLDWQYGYYVDSMDRVKENNAKIELLIIKQGKFNLEFKIPRQIIKELGLTKGSCFVAKTQDNIIRTLGGIDKDYRDLDMVKVATITDFNYEHRFFVLRLDDDASCNLLFSHEHTAHLDIGDRIEVIIAHNSGVASRDVSRAIYISKLNQRDERVKTTFRGTIYISKQGFISIKSDVNVFISFDFVSKYDLHDGDLIQGIAHMTYNRKRNTWSFRAVEIQKI